MITISTNAANVIQSLQKYSSDLDKRSEKLTAALVLEGFNYMWDRNNNAVYDGDKDTWVSSETRKAEGEIALNGKTAAFIEFGTGIAYPDDHPQAAEFGAIRGAYGRGQGANPPWVYYGKSPGSNGVVIPSKHGRLVVQTMGNPANYIVYDTGKLLKQRYISKAKEVF